MDELAPLLPEECELLWDAFEKVDHLAFGIATGYVPVRDREALKRASTAYRLLRDRIELARQVRAANGAVEGTRVEGVVKYSDEVTARIEAGVWAGVDPEDPEQFSIPQTAPPLVKGQRVLVEVRPLPATGTKGDGR
jgi:hypothetical protein